jgi:hypothetical protein
MTKVVISDRNRALFEGIALSAIRRELALGSINYLGTDQDPRRAQAREWVAEQDAQLEKEKRDARALETRRFRSILGWAIAGVIVAVVAAAAAVIAEWPVVNEWIR